MVPEVVESELLIGRVRNVCGVRLLSLRFGHVRLNEPHVQPQKPVNLPALETCRHITDEDVTLSKTHAKHMLPTEKMFHNEAENIKMDVRALVLTRPHQFRGGDDIVRFIAKGVLPTEKSLHTPLLHSN